MSDVLILGAGAAGLAAARALADSGLELSILEARNRIGGRMHTVHDPHCEAPVELGAEFVHGRVPEIFDTGLPIYEGPQQLGSVISSTGARADFSPTVTPDPKPE